MNRDTGPYKPIPGSYIPTFLAIGVVIAWLTITELDGRFLWVWLGGPAWYGYWVGTVVGERRSDIANWRAAHGYLDSAD